MSDVIHLTIIHTDGTNLFPKPKQVEDEQVDTFMDEDSRWKEIGTRVGTQNRIYFDMNTIDEDSAWIICSGPIPVSEEKLREIVQRERLSIWKPRSIKQWVEFILD